ncbi:MAG: hypothetical protein CML37_02200 [Rhodobacteraceae bacterium]|nr:hypothetical protein [Paracoccaceae bacterium]
MYFTLFFSYRPFQSKANIYFFFKTFVVGVILLNFFFHELHAEDSQLWGLESFSHQVLNKGDPNFGGLSGISMSADGNHFVAISDRANYFKGETVRDSAKKLVDLKILERGKILDSKGQELSGRNTDSESIIRSKDNGYYVSFESNNRIMFHPKLSAPGQFLPKHVDFKRLRYNDGIEALAVNTSGQIYAIPEMPPNGDKFHPIYKFRENKWQVITTVEISDDFKVSEAEFIDDKNLILLERKFTFLDGFEIRIRRLTLERDEIKSVQILLESGPWEFFNLEGLSKWKDTLGNTYITLVSDNQFSPLLKTEIREFQVIEKK